MGVVREHPLTDVMAECDGEIRCDCSRGIDFLFLSLFFLFHFFGFRINARTRHVCLCVRVGGGGSGGLLRFLRFKDDHHTNPPWDFYLSALLKDL